MPFIRRKKLERIKAEVDRVARQEGYGDGYDDGFAVGRRIPKTIGEALKLPKPTTGAFIPASVKDGGL